MNAAIRRHWAEVLALGCLVTRTPYVPDREGPYRLTIHHVHGGSMIELGHGRTFGRKMSDWLVVPIIALIHTGPGGIDGYPKPSVLEWEFKYRKQSEMLDEVVRRTGRDVWTLARNEQRGMVPRKVALR